MDNAMCLDLGETDHEVMRGKLMHEIDDKEKDLVKRIGDLEGHVNSVLEKISSAISHNHSDANSIKEGIADYMTKLNNGELEDALAPVLQRNPSSPEEPGEPGSVADQLLSNINDNKAAKRGLTSIMNLVVRSMKLPFIEDDSHLQTAALSITCKTQGVERVSVKAKSADKAMKLCIFDDSGVTVTFSTTVEDALGLVSDVDFVLMTNDLISSQFKIPLKEIAANEEKEWTFSFFVGEVESSITMYTSSMPVD
jgi:hypothetical protein